MAVTKNNYNSVAALRNMSALVDLIDRTQNRQYGLPGMACFYGFAGFGKTWAATYAANKFQAYVVQVNDHWRARFFCQAVLRDMGLKPTNTVAEMIEQIGQHMGATGRCLIIDEADHLIKRNMIELTRSIYEASGQPVILIGEEGLPQNLQQWERVHSRMLSWVAAQPVVISEMKALADIYCPGVRLDDALLAGLLRACGGSVRRICTNLAGMREFAAKMNRSELTPDSWGKNTFDTGEAPVPRRAVA